MQSYMNGYRPSTIASIVIEQSDPRADLDEYDSTISDLNDALVDAAMARLRLDQLHRQLESIEASVMLTIEDGNAETRKARLMLALNDDYQYTETVTVIDVQRARLLDAERRVQVAKERARLLRAALALHTSE